MKNQIYCICRLILIVMTFSILINSNVIAQKKKPPRNTSIPQDSTIIEQITPQSSESAEPELPTIELDDHTIIGKRIIKNVPDSEKSTDKTNVPIITSNPTGEGKGNRYISGAGGMKQDQSINYLASNINNEFYASYGRYNDFNVGLKLQRKYIDDELFADLDYRWNDGHINNSEFNYFRNTLTNIHRFNRYIQNKIQFSLLNDTYNFYGAEVDPDEQRSRVNLDVSSTTGISGWNVDNIRWDAGIRYMDPDESQLFNWGLWTDIYASETLGSSFLTAKLKINSDRIEIPINVNQLDSLYDWIDRNTNLAPIKYLEKIRDDITNNSLLSEAFYGNFNSTIEHVLMRYLKFKGGVNISYFNSSNRHGILFDQGNGSSEDDLTTIYPILGLELNLGQIGTIFGKFEPHLDNISLTQILNTNPYVNLSAPLSYHDVVTDLRVGWRRSGTYNLSFETFYNFKEINNYSVFVPQSSGSTAENFGHWDIIFGNDIKLHNFRALLNWQINNSFSLWSGFGYNDYSIAKSNFIDQIPYYPKYDFDFTLSASPGMGLQLMLTGQFISEQLTKQNESIDNDKNVIDPYFVSNFSISKKFGKHIEIYGQLNNILNSDYEIWDGYVAPDLNGWGGIKILW